MIDENLSDLTSLLKQANEAKEIVSTSSLEHKNKALKAAAESLNDSRKSLKSANDLDMEEASKKDLVKISKNIEQEMKLAADLLEFELAARLRDELKDLRREIQEIVE